MSDDPPDVAADGAADRRLQQLLGQLQAHPPEPSLLLLDRVLGTARWEQGVRQTGHALGGFGATLMEGLAILLGVRKARR
jgi:hypothetical protein